METGKVPPELLSRLLTGTDVEVPDLVLGPRLGRDAAVVQFADGYAVLASDPVTFPTARPGWYVVHVNANDVACLGAEPRWFLATILVPPTTDETELEAIFHHLRAACTEVGATLAGGHTEVSDAVTRPVVAGTMIGEVPPQRLHLAQGARSGDALIQIGAIAIEGTALLAIEIPDRLRAAGLSSRELEQAQALLVDPGISVLPMARAIWPLPGLHALHDPTEGGIATACWELAEGAGLGITLESEAMVVHPLSQRVCAALEVDALGLLASGTLLAAVEAETAAEAVRELNNSGHSAAVIGHLGEPAQPAILVADGATRALPRFWRDEVARILAP
jgi:hydrogenase expression/formation protein HypE